MAVLGLIVASVAAAAAVVFGFGEWRTRRESVSLQRFIDARVALRSDRASLSRAALEGSEHELNDVGLLGRASWVPDLPVPLSGVAVRWNDESASVENALGRARALLPTHAGSQYATYSDAVAAVEQPPEDLWFDGNSYRLIDVAIDGQKVDLELTSGKYFAALNTTEVIGYERALGRRARYRKWLGEPFDLKRRVAIPGVSTITLRRDGTDGRFFMHVRGRTAVAAGTVHVIPAGEFQPCDETKQAFRRDLSLWSSICREYAEEFLGHADAARPGGWMVPRDGEPYRSLDAGCADGSITPWFLGIGFDPLTWKPEILTACVIEAEVFDEIFRDQLHENNEGQVHAGVNGMPFDDANVNDYLSDERLLAAGRACLTLAWRHRGVLLGSV